MKIPIICRWLQNVIDEDETADGILLGEYSIFNVAHVFESDDTMWRLVCTTTGPGWGIRI